jgi:formylglycine-generating enzyme required for sulfatase activity
MSNSHSNNFFVVGGTLGRDASSYVHRPVDEELLRLTLQGEYCNVLAARQTGKSSLMVRSSERLKREGVRSVIIDLTSIGSAVSPSEWYFGLLSRLKTELKLEVDEQAWWQARSEKSPIQRFSDFLREVVLEEIPEKIVIFVDEIDSTLKLNFTDDFFAAIRAAYNARSRDRAFDRLTFVLLGVARPADLIKDRTRTPYNIGTSVDVTDFQQDELQGFEDVLEEALPRQGREVLSWALNWTGGQPYLTQKLCAEIIEQANGKLSEEVLSDLVENLFLGDQARTETNLRSIRDRTSGNPYAAKMLRIYKKVLKSKEVPSEERSIEQNELKLTGLVKVSSQGNLQVRNRIYARTFDLAWVKDNIPITTGQRMTMILSIITVLALGFSGYFYYQQQNQAREVLAQTYTENFTTSASQEIRISGLAGLIELGDEYATQGKELFNTLSHEEQLALLTLETPENVGNELFSVTQALYQEQRNTSEGNDLLMAMAGVLERTSASGATSLTLEINAWLDGRGQVELEQYQIAITFYTNALEKSRDRGQENSGVLFDRALANTLIEEYELALTDFDNAVGLSIGRVSDVENFILSNRELIASLRENATEYPNLETITLPDETVTLPTLTPTPALGIGATMVSEKDNMTLSYIPAGEFEMGSEDGYDFEKPVHTVYLDAYWLDQTEVTNEMYSNCVNEGVCNPPSNTIYYSDSLYADHPVVYMNWDDANTYCIWAGRELPSEAQWEKGARGGLEGMTYSWGNELPVCTPGAVNGAKFRDNGEQCLAEPTRRTVPVGSYAPNGYGVYDTIGNVQEWVADWLSETYYAESPASNPTGPLSGSEHVIRNGNWFRNSSESVIHGRLWLSLADFNGLGFRCARDMAP